MLADTSIVRINKNSSFHQQKQYIQNKQIPQAVQTSAQQISHHQSQKKNQIRYSSSHYSKSYHQKVPFIVGVHFKVGKKIGEGSFGVIYEGIY